MGSDSENGPIHGRSRVVGGTYDQKRTTARGLLHLLRRDPRRHARVTSNGKGACPIGTTLDPIHTLDRGLDLPVVSQVGFS